MTSRVCVIPGDESAPEAVLPALGVLRQMELDIEYEVLPPGEQGVREYGDQFEQVCIEAIDACDTTLFGASSGLTRALGYLRWQKHTFANVRPVRYFEGAVSPLREPEGIDFVIVRENTEDLYSGIEGAISQLRTLDLRSRLDNAPLPEEGRFALKVITEAKSRRIVEFAFDLARRRRQEGHAGKVTASAKYNMLRESDGLFRAVAQAVAAENPDVEFEEFIVDDFARRIVASPRELDVVVLPNLYGDILSDEAAALVGGLGMSPSGCYGDDFAYFEPVHGTAPDIQGTGRINPTATLLSAAMMLEHLNLGEAAARIEAAIKAVYADGSVTTPDQGGTASAVEFCEAVIRQL